MIERSSHYTVEALVGDSMAVEVGDLVLAMGNPFGIGQTVTMGIVSATGRAGLNIENYEDFIQTDAEEVGEMVRSRDVVQAEGSARTEGARRATGVPADGAAAGAGSLAPGQRWSASRKRDVVLRLLRGESLEALSREVGVEIYRLDAWRARAMAGLEFGLKARHGEPVAEVLDAAKRHIGELSMEIELLRERARAAEQRLPLAMRRSRR